VASEVRALALRSSTAAREIKALIGESAAKVQAGTQLVDDAGRTMQEILDSVSRVSQLIGDIAQAGGAQSADIGSASQAIAQIDAMTQQNSALVEQLAAAAQSLKGQSDRLSSAMGSFRVAGCSERHAGFGGAQRREALARARMGRAVVLQALVPQCGLGVVGRAAQRAQCLKRERIGLELVAMRLRRRSAAQRSGHRLGGLRHHFAGHETLVEVTHLAPVALLHVAQLVSKHKQADALGRVGKRLVGDDHAAVQRFGHGRAGDHAELDHQIGCDSAAQHLEALPHGLGARAVGGQRHRVEPALRRLVEHVDDVVGLRRRCNASCDHHHPSKPPHRTPRCEILLQ
jgi:hypothetical protein